MNFDSFTVSISVFCREKARLSWRLHGFQRLQGISMLHFWSSLAMQLKLGNVEIWIWQKPPRRLWLPDGCLCNHSTGHCHCGQFLGEKLWEQKNLQTGSFLLYSAVHLKKDQGFNILKFDSIFTKALKWASGLRYQEKRPRILSLLISAIGSFKDPLYCFVRWVLKK